MASVCILLLILYARLSMSWMSCVSVERCFLNPCCASWRMLCLSKCFMMLLVISGGGWMALVSLSVLSCLAALFGCVFSLDDYC